MGTNADHQRAWRQRQKLRIAALEASKPKKNRLAKDGEPISALISELLEIMLEFLPRVEATVAALGSRIDNELRDGLFDTLHAVANEMSRVAQSLPTEPILRKDRVTGHLRQPERKVATETATKTLTWVNDGRETVAKLPRGSYYVVYPTRTIPGYAAQRRTASRIGAGDINIGRADTIDRAKALCERHYARR